MAGIALALSAAAALPGCPSSRECTPEYEKQLVLDAARSWYLHPELLASVNPADYPDSQSMLDALVAPAVAAGTDRGWSFVTTTAEQQQFYEEGKAVGFGIGILVRRDKLNAPHLYVSQVYALSPAAAVFGRGDEILEVGDSEAALTPVGGLIAGGTLSQALGPPEVGATRTFRFAPKADPANPIVRTVTKAIFDISPVAYVGIIPSTTAGLSRDVGVVVLRTFISTADAKLDGALSYLKTNLVTDVVIDVRYNGGGLLSTAERLANLLGGGLSGRTMYEVVNNGAHAGLNGQALFAPPSQSIEPSRVAFVTTGATASASELVPNVLEPYLAPAGGPALVALVGSRTYGKPVGQRGFDLSPCPKVLYLVSFGLQNADGEGSYFSGLPDTAQPPAFGGPLCEAADDLLHEQGAPAEESTAAALQWIETGSCPAAPAPLAAARALSISEPDAYPRPARPTPAQVENPGFF